MRTTALILAAATALCCVSCGKSSSSDENDTNITGKWRINGEGADGGYIFEDNGTACVYFNPVDTYFENGDLFLSGTHVGGDRLSYDGDILKATLMDEDILILDRIGEPDASSYEGSYVITGGTMLEGIMKSLNIDTNEPPELQFRVEDNKATVVAVDVIDYTFDGKTLDLRGKHGFPSSSGEAERKGSSITIKRENGTSRTLNKVK